MADLYNPIIQHGEVDFVTQARSQTWANLADQFSRQSPAPFTKPAEMDSKALAEALLFSEENIVRELATAELRTRDPDVMFQH